MNLLLGCGMTIICMAILCFLVDLILRGLHAMDEKHLIGTSFFLSWALLISVLLVFFIINLLQAALWAGLFLNLGEFEDFNTAFYYSLVNFATLGYGDIVMSPARRILGALEAANGVLMMGVTTSVLYSTVTSIMRLRRQYKEKRKTAGKQSKAKQK